MASETIQILLVEDDPTDAEYTRAMLTQVRDTHVEVQWVTSVAAGLEALRSTGYDVALVDYLLGRENGLDLVREATRLELTTPMILLTGRGSRDVDLEAQEAGAADYLVKGRIDPDTLERALRYTLDRARSRAALVESEARFRGLFDHLPLGLFRCTPDGGFLDANPALVALLGHPSPELLRSRYAAGFYAHPADLPRLKEALDSDGVVRGFESWIERSDGFHVPVRLTARAHRDTHGHIAYVEGAVEDVREVEHVRRLRLAGNRFRVLFDQLSLAALVTDAAGGVLDVSPAGATRLGREPSELVTRPFGSLVDEAAADRWREALAAFAAGSVTPVSFAASRGEGTPQLRVVCAPVAEDDDPVEVLILLGDEPGP